MSKKRSIAEGYRLSLAQSYVRRAERIVRELGFLNHKIEGDFFCIMNFFKEKSEYIRKEHKEAINE